MTKEKVTEQTADTLTLNPPDVFPDFAISLEEANRRVKMLQEFVRDHMVEGEDYGVIPGTQAKPTLFKPGAEKLNAIFGWSDRRHENTLHLYSRIGILQCIVSSVHERSDGMASTTQAMEN